LHLSIALILFSRSCNVGKETPLNEEEEKEKTV
jgi:hypothetical protein